jgi:aryl-alcohol dehydrogenase-like predicted oxidoreductase
MKTLSLPGIDAPVSVIVQGSLGLLWGEDADAFSVLDAAVEAGISAFDTAHVYDFDGRGVDRLLGRWLARHGDRERLVIMAKGCHPDMEGNPRVTPVALSADVNDTLERSGLAHIDLWSFHRDDVSVPVGELVEAANAEIASGRIAAWGVSNWSTARVEEAIAHATANRLAGPAANSAHYSLATQLEPPWDDVVSLTGDGAAADRGWHRASRLPVVAWSSLAGGYLSANLTRAALENPENDHIGEVARCYADEINWGRRERATAVAAQRGVSLSQIAVAWVLGDEMSTLAITGGASVDEVQQNAAAVEIELTSAERERIYGGPIA